MSENEEEFLRMMENFWKQFFSFLFSIFLFFLISPHQSIIIPNHKGECLRIKVEPTTSSGQVVWEWFIFFFLFSILSSSWNPAKSCNPVSTIHYYLFTLRNMNSDERFRWSQMIFLLFAFWFTSSISIIPPSFPIIN